MLYYLILALIAVLAAILCYEGICNVMANARLRVRFVPPNMQESWSYKIVLPLLDIVKAAIWLSVTFGCMVAIARLWMA